jgi:hypothetical protein
MRTLLKKADTIHGSAVVRRGILVLRLDFLTDSKLYKLSLLLSYLRFMTKGTARNATITVMVACVAFHVSFLLVQINLCQPVSFGTNWPVAISHIVG